MLNGFPQHLPSIQAHPPMKTVLLAWELGGGMGHVMTLRRLARRLRLLDLRVVAAVKNLDAARLLCSEGIEIIEAPAWPSASMSARQIAATSSASMGDILATAGLGDADGLRRLLGAWDHVLLRFTPDLVVSHLAPAVALAARGRVPLILVGDGYTLPPDGMRQFPPLHAMTSPGDETVTLEVLNSVLRSRGETRLDYLPQVFFGDARLVLTFPLLDPYFARRTEPLLGPLLDHVPVAAVPKKRSVFAYLSRGYPLHRDIPAALLAHAPVLRIHAPDLPEHQMDDLMQAGAIVCRDFVAPADALTSAALVVHFGGSGLAAEALLAGVPQLVLSMQIEQWLNGSALQSAGLGRVIKAYDPGTRIESEIDNLLADTAIVRAAADAGRRHRELLSRTDALMTFESACRSLLGI
jgi:hypothetical protein